MRYKNLKNLKRHAPAVILGACCWGLIYAVTGTACWFRAALGFPCPGCGTSRAAAALVRGDIKQALEFHPLIFVTLVLFAVLVLKINKINMLKSNRANILLWGIFAVYAAVFAARMVLFYPDAEPLTYLETSLLGRFSGFIGNIYSMR